MKTLKNKSFSMDFPEGMSQNQSTPGGDLPLTPHQTNIDLPPSSNAPNKKRFCRSIPEICEENKKPTIIHERYFSNGDSFSKIRDMMAKVRAKIHV